MKNSEHVTGQFSLEKGLEDIKISFGASINLFLITDFDTCRINYINKMVYLLCGINSEEIINGQKNFYSEVIHPDDQQRYLKHLSSLEEINSYQDKDIIIRLKTSEENWVDFCFKSRLYNWSPNGERQAILTRAYRVEQKEYNAEDQKNPCDYTAEDNQTPTRYQQLLNSIDEAYCVIEILFDRNGNPVDYLFLETNPAFETHVNLKDVAGKTMRELVPNHDEHWFRIYGEIAVTGNPSRFQEVAQKLGGVWFDVYSFRVGGDYSRSVAVLFHNITERKLAEETLTKTKSELEERAKQRQEELLENSQLLQSVFDNTNLAIAVFQALYDDHGTIKDFLFVRINEVLRKMYKKEDPLGKTYSQTSKFGLRMGLMDAFKKVMQTGEVLEKEYFFDKEGYSHWFRVTARRQNKFLIASIEDVSDRKAENQKLKEAIKFNRQLVQTSPDTILIINLNEFKIRYINQDMLASAGMTKKRINGMTLPEILPFMHPRDREKLIEFHKKLLKSTDDEIHEMDFRVKVKGTEWEWFNARGKIFSRRNETWVDEYVILLRNITQQKNTQRSLINAEKLSIQGEVARTFAHELRNPLASIRMATDVIKQKLEKHQKDSLGNYLNILSRSTKVLNDLVSNLLNASNYSPVDLQKVDLVECVEHTLEQAADRIYLTGIKLIKDYQSPCYITGDRDKLKIALLNIIVNASEAITPEKGIIEVSIKPHKTDYLLRISDNGHGLEQEQIDRLFDAFYTNKSTGTGIGLTSVKNILEEHDAHIKVSSKVKKGTTFEISFHNAELE